MVGRSVRVISLQDGGGFEHLCEVVGLELPDVQRATGLSGPNTGTSP